GRNDDVFDRAGISEKSPHPGLVQRCAAFLVPKRLRSYMQFDDDSHGRPEEASNGGGGDGGDGWSSEQCDLLRRDVETLDVLVLKLEDLAGTLRDAMQLSSSQSAPQSPGAGSQYHHRAEGPPYFIRFQLPIVALVQVLWVGMLATFDNVVDDRGTNTYLYLVDCIMVVLQVVNILHVGLASWTLTHQMLKFRAASGFLMAQTYLSTVLLFSGFYLIIYRLDPASWELSVSDPITKGGAFTQHIRMFYLSVSSATLCGAANIQPVSWYATVFLCIQSLVNFVYFASILAQTIGHCGTSETLLERRERLQSISRRLSSRAARPPPPPHGATDS
ncbi:unnamed protein product, partial [Ixodes hexagonus]